MSLGRSQHFDTMFFTKVRYTQVGVIHVELRIKRFLFDYYRIFLCIICMYIK